MKAKKATPPFVNFTVSREYLDQNGIWNPRDKAPPLKAAFQVNVYGAREHYSQLADFFREFAERDTSDDSDYHEHFEGLTCSNGNVRLHLILRKDDIGDSGWSSCYAPPKKKSQKTKRK
jgi:hypothetical protein